MENTHPNEEQPIRWMLLFFANGDLNELHRFTKCYM